MNVAPSRETAGELLLGKLIRLNIFYVEYMMIHCNVLCVCREIRDVLCGGQRV